MLSDRDHVVPDRDDEDGNREAVPDIHGAFREVEMRDCPWLGVLLGRVERDEDDNRSNDNDAIDKWGGPGVQQGRSIAAAVFFLTIDKEVLPVVLGEEIELVGHDSGDLGHILAGLADNNGNDGEEALVLIAAVVLGPLEVVLDLLFNNFFATARAGHDAADAAAEGDE